MKVKIEKSWGDALAGEFQKPYFENLANFVKEEYTRGNIFPPAKYIFRAFNECPVKKTKVVILGQDPYPTPGHANGLAFSVNPGTPLPGSLKNIIKEVKSDIGEASNCDSGDLSTWARQGVLLLNTSLTVRRGKPASHSKKGWEKLTDSAIKAVSKEKQGVVYMLWGSHAQKKQDLIDSEKNLILCAPHPSPLSAHKGFLGCRHFSKANAYLIMQGLEPIKW